MNLELLEHQIRGLESTITIKLAQGYKAEELSEEIHDLAILKEQLNEKY